MALKTVNVSEETKKFLDAIADVMDYTQDRAVQLALYKICPVSGWQNMSIDELKMAIAKHQIRRMRFYEDLAIADKYGIDLSEVGSYPPDLDGIRDYDKYCSALRELDEVRVVTVVKKKEESS